MAHDPDSSNHYIHHLTKVNETNTVLTSEDIHNTQGGLVIAKGNAITPAVAKQIAQHKLSKSIDNSITLERSYSAVQMYECMLMRLEETSLDRVIQDFNLERILKVHLKYALNQPILKLKISVFAECFPVLFNRSLILACLSLAVCKEMRSTSDTAKDVFLAALLADIGLLHIEPAIANQEGKFSDKEWALYQGHVAISKSFADIVPELNPTVGRAIMEHHERSDGFGYPLQKNGDQLCIEGSILAKVDTVIAIFRKRILEEGYPFSVVMPVLQFSSASHNPEVNKAAMRLMYQITSKMGKQPHQRPVLKLIPDLIDLLKRLNAWIAQSQQLIENYKQELANPLAKRQLKMYLKLKRNLDSSGLLSTHQEEWLNDVIKNEDQNEFHVVEQFAVMLYEIEFQCSQTQRHFDPIIPQIFGPGKETEYVQQVGQKLRLLLQNKQ